MVRKGSHHEDQAVMKRVASRKISFPLEDVFQSSVQENDNMEVWRLLRVPHPTLDVNSCNHAGLTALHHSVLNNNLDAAKMLLCSGADTALGDAHEFTPLHTAAACGYLQLASLLMLFGADVFRMTSEGDLPIDLAKDSAMTEILHQQMMQRLQSQVYMESFITYYAKEYWRALCRLCFWIWTCIKHIWHQSRTNTPGNPGAHDIVHVNHLDSNHLTKLD